MDLSNKTEAELNLMTKAQIITALTEDRRETKTTISAGDKRGQLREVRETRKLDGTMESSSEVLWTYWPNGNVRDITMTEKDNKGVETKRQVVKHGEGGGIATKTLKGTMV